jgi:hypothetical protein
MGTSDTRPLNVYMDDVRQCPYAGWSVVRTIEEMMVLLTHERVDRCSLDHDMGSCDGCKRGRRDIGDMLTPETTFMHWCPHALDGTKLVRWMIETGHWSLTKPLVHSANPVGTKRMREDIDRYFGKPAQGPMF